MGGAIRVHGAPRRRPLRVKAVTGRNRVVPRRTDAPVTVKGPAEARPMNSNLTSRPRLRERPKPNPWTWSKERVRREGPPKRNQVSRPEDPGPVSDRDRTAGRGRHAWVRMKVGKRQLPVGWLRLRSPEGEVGRGYLTDASHDGTPEGVPAARRPGRCPFITEAMIGRPQRALHGNEDTGPRGGCANTIP